MSRFKDAAGREWDLRLTTSMLRKVRERTGVALGEAIADERKLAEMMFADPVSFEGILWALVEEQARAQSIDLDNFGSALDGPAIERATTAFLESICFFSRRQMVAEAAVKRIPGLMGAMDRATIEAMDRLANEAERKLSTPSASAGDSLASPGSTPTR